MTPKKPSQTINLFIKMGSFGYQKMFGDMVLRYMPNSDPWGPPGTRVMTICVFYVNPQIPNIEILKHMTSTNPGRYLIFFIIKFPFEWRQNHVWKGGREEARKGGREEGRKTGREEGELPPLSPPLRRAKGYPIF